MLNNNIFMPMSEKKLVKATPQLLRDMEMLEVYGGNYSSDWNVYIALKCTSCSNSNCDGAKCACTNSSDCSTQCNKTGSKCGDPVPNDSLCLQPKSGGAGCVPIVTNPTC